MSGRTRQRTSTRTAAHDADPWWGEAPTPAPKVAEPAVDQPRRRRAPRGVTRTTRTSRNGAGMKPLGLVAAPLQMALRVVARSERLRRLAFRLAVVLCILGVLACSVGVILINNVVMGRTAELGELEDRRRELRRENALLSAEAARQAASTVVVRRAERELGMVPTRVLPQFIYLDPANRALTPLQRRRVAARVAREERIAAAAASSTSSTDTAATTASAPPVPGDAR